MTNPRPLHPAHVAAVRAAATGEPVAALAAFAAALPSVGNDVRFLADYASCASSAGDPALAASLYARAIAATPGDAPPLRLRHALALMDAGELLRPTAMLGALTRDHPRSAMAWQALGAARRSADRAVEAAAAFDRVLAIAPADPLGRLSRAQILADLGASATSAFTAALAVAPDNPAARLGLASAQAAAGQPEMAEATVRAGVARSPDWADGWAALVSLTYRWSGRAAALATIDEALAAAARHPGVALAMIRGMAAIGDHAAVLGTLPAVCRAIGDTLPLALAEAQAASETGDIERADTAFARLATIDDPVVLLARLRHALRARRPEAAVAIGDPMMAGPAAAFATPYLGTAWRLLGDPCHDWLEGDPRLVGAYDLGLDRAEIAALADELRALHTAPHPPFEQSMRGGTQTEGVLLSRQSPAIRRLRAALTGAIEAHVRQLPPADPSHPTLSVARDAFRFSGSWSVRLAGGGHHVNHVHSEGWLSSACYVALPDAATDAQPGDDQSGWLALGQPPVELALDLAPTRMVRPVAGQVVLFPSTMWHGTRPAPAGERLTVAFDVKPLI